jgi:segregation and condensation protein B
MSPKLSLEQTLEAVLFVASEPVSLSQLADITGQPQSKVKAALTALSDSLNDHGIRLIQHQEQYTLVTHPAASEQVEQF